MLKYVIILLSFTTFAFSANPSVPFVIPNDLPPDFSLALKSSPIGDAQSRLIVRDAHFFDQQGKRVRIWGVNLAFSACFPTHEESAQLARRLEAFGINSIRIHHIDMSPFPGGIWDPNDPMKFSDEALDRMDYLIDQCAKHGIYTNLNLHVSRTNSRYLNLPEAKAAGNYDKVVDFIHPQLIDAEKDYARRLLTRENKYRKQTYAADPAIAFVEINNENSLFIWEWESKLRKLQPVYLDILQAKFNDWLTARYSSNDALKKAWQPEAAPPPMPLTPLPVTGKDWKASASGGASVSQSVQDGVLRIAPKKIGEATWNLQLNRPGLQVKAKQQYKLSFRARADESRSISVRMQQANDPFRTFGLAKDVSLTTEWNDYSALINCDADEPEARVSIVFGNSAVPWEISDVTLKSVEIIGLSDSEDLSRKDVRFIPDNESPARRDDRLIFLAEQDREYFESFYAFLKKDLACQSLITGTMVYGPASVWSQSSMDFIDNHAYWCHPKFPPGKGWNPTQWTVEQRAMVSVPGESKLHPLAATRLHGKPFTVSEYNHAAPNDYQAETVPMIASFAAAQDWDGVWFYCYKQRSISSAPGFFQNYFEIDQNPSKMAFLISGAKIFRDAGIEPLGAKRVIPFSDGSLKNIVQQQLRFHLSVLGAMQSQGKLSREDLHTAQIAATLSKEGSTSANPSQTILNWSPGNYTATGRRAMARVQAEPFSSMTAVALDDQPLESSNRVLFTLLGRCENTDMQFNKDRTTVSDKWGKAPVLIEPIETTIEWKLTSPAKLFPVDATGQRGTPMEITPVNGRATLQFGPADQTLWYLLERP